MITRTKSSSIHIRVNEDVKKKALPILNDLSITLGDYVNLALSQLANQHKVPFEIVDSTYYAFSPELEEAIIETRKAVKNGTAKVYNTVSDMFKDLDEEADDE
ncbi:MAG: type II toxin-antitoxin system RelB/DinJ family antitoxin [Firmicutes bacterium]|nr:type II toxin-antitoxin system RelB/DinJ family antitoxin [Bacillota bacterium]